MTTRRGLKQSLDVMLRGTRAKDIPLIIGSAGIGGAWSHVLLFQDIIEEIARERGLHFRMALINSDVDKGWLKGKLREEKVHPLGPVPALTAGDIDRSTNIVAMMGTEPIVQALEEGANVVVAGRASDSALFAAIPSMWGFDPGLTWHMSKIIECGSVCTEPVEGVETSVIARLRKDHFIIEPTHPEGICNVLRVAAHTLFENVDPYLMPEPGHITDASDAQFEQIDPRRVKVSGSRATPQPYTVKLEGAEAVGYRTITIASIRDPYLVSRIGDFLARGEEIVHHEVAPLGISRDDYTLFFRLYGKDGTMEPWHLGEEVRPSREVCVIGECIARTQEIANTVMNFGHNVLLHQHYPGELCSAGSAAFPYSPHDVEMGPVYRFNVWHTVDMADPMETFSIEMVEV